VILDNSLRCTTKISRYKFYLWFKTNLVQTERAKEYMENVGTTAGYKFLRHNCGQIAIDAIEFAIPGINLERRIEPKRNFYSEVNRGAANGWGVGGPP
jgi:hypothetical protein